MKKLSVLIVITIVSIIFWSCSKNYLDINTPNPNLATNATPELIITNAMTTTAAIQVANGVAQPMTFLNGWMGYWANSGSYAQNSDDVASYKETTNYGNVLWGYDYHNLEDYYTVEQSAILEVKPYYEAMAKVMKAYVFQQLVDMFGNVPYSNAFQGTLAITPKYDSAQNIYLDIAKQCDSAVALMLSPSAIATSITSDIMFGGNNQLWIQFANTLKLRILMRQTQIPGQGAYITAEIAKIVANGGGFLTQDAAIGTIVGGMAYANNGGQQSPVWGYFRTITNHPTSGGQADYWRASSYGINILQGNADPRLPFIYAPDQSGVTYTGCVLGSPNNPPGEGASSLGSGLLVSASQPSILMSAAESNFLQAEAIVRGYMSGDDAAAYSAGVQASFNYLGAGDATAYLAQSDPNTNYALATTTAEKIAIIIWQKWIAENGVTPFETWCDYRRLGLPSTIPLSISPYKAGNTVPVRLLYPVSEYTTNTANVNAQGNIDYNATKIFWNQ